MKIKYEDWLNDADSDEVIAKRVDLEGAPQVYFPRAAGNVIRGCKLWENKEDGFDLGRAPRARRRWPPGWWIFPGVILGLLIWAALIQWWW